MARKILHSQRARLWELVREQYGVIARRQLLRLGYSSGQIEQRLRNGRLHRLFPGVYAVGRPEVTRQGWWMAATLAAGEGAALSHGSGAALYGIRDEPAGPIHVSVPLTARRSRDGIEVHRRKLLPSEYATHERILVATVPVIVTDLAAELRRGPLESAINQADILGLTTTPKLRAAVDAMPIRPGRRNLRETIDRRTFRFTRSALERAFIPLAMGAGLSRPDTACMVCGWEVDFYWPAIGLVVETDSLTYHRTAQAQDKDRRRDQAHIAAGLTPLRFTHSQIRYEPGYVRAMLATVARRLGRAKEARRQLEQVGHG